MYVCSLIPPPSPHFIQDLGMHACVMIRHSSLKRDHYSSPLKGPDHSSEQGEDSTQAQLL